ncbi:MAG: hypothetical protein U1E51_07100 [Candidatus Binatia bacterium]|nr:hypothetical protein [Candidatus Binatia bacterium]
MADHKHNFEMSFLCSICEQRPFVVIDQLEAENQRLQDALERTKNTVRVLAAHWEEYAKSERDDIFQKIVLAITALQGGK